MELDQALPKDFAFYEMGEILAQAETPQGTLAPEALSDCAAVSIRFDGDISGTLILLFDRGLDLDVYSEVANVLASRFATSLASELDVMITPPSVLSETQIQRLPQLAAVPTAIARAYRHVLSDGRSLPLQFLVIPSTRPNSRKGGARA